ncbi:MAG: hypothetical protein HC822_25810, partial [Oscillochloris sp.]|nr:hypothetical protein [Oscillochloris sp.]
ARRARDRDLVLGYAVDGSLLLREQIDGRWRDSRYTPSLSIKKVAPVEIPPVDELRLARLRRASLPRTGTWEADTFPLPEPVQNSRDERPYFPIACLFVDGPTGMVLAPQIAAPDTWRAGLQQLFVELVEQQQVVPRQVVVMNAELRDLLKPAVEGVGSNVRLVKRMPALEQARDSLLSYMDR